MTIPQATRALGNTRLLRLAAILDKADAYHREHNEPPYNQVQFQYYGSDENVCGTPACALGHWIFANSRNKRGRCYFTSNSLGWKSARPYDSVLDGARRDFSLTASETLELFASCGCNDAKTAAQAAAYIRGFVARRTQAGGQPS